MYASAHIRGFRLVLERYARGISLPFPLGNPLTQSAVGLFSGSAQRVFNEFKDAHEIEDRGEALILRPLDREEPSVALPALTARKKFNGAMDGTHSEEAVILPKEDDPTIEERLTSYLYKYTATDHPDETSKTMAYCSAYYGDNKVSFILPNLSTYSLFL